MKHNKPPQTSTISWTAYWRAINQLAIALLAALTLAYPGYITVRAINDEALRAGPGISPLVYQWHRQLAPKYARWAEARVASDGATKLKPTEVAATEWPLFGSLFFLLATDALQTAWQEDQIGPEPMSYSRPAVAAATALVVDPKHATWVRERWGDDYMDRENAFYRMLRIGSMAAYTRLTGDGCYAAMLRQEATALAAELDATPFGLVNDYPGECYPADVAMAWRCIQLADEVLGTDHAAEIARGVRGFQDELLVGPGVPAYAAVPHLGAGLDPARGCNNSYMALSSPWLWPDEAREWYALHDEHFWQVRYGIAGFREFMPGEENEWYVDVDSGPVIAGFGVSASAFGLGAARANGRFDHAYPLAVEMIASSWPLPGGTLWGPRAFSHASDAPYLGEAAVLYNLAHPTAPDFEVKTGGVVPPYVYGWLAGYFGLALVVIALAARTAKRALRDPEAHIPWPRTQAAVYLGSLLIAAVLFIAGFPLQTAIALLVALMLPRGAGRQRTTST